MTMLPDIRLLTAAINVAVGNWPTALRLIRECIDAAVQQQCSVLAFSELTLASIDARDTLKSLTNEEICQRLRIIATYAYTHNPDLMIFIGHPWQGPSIDTTSEYSDLPLTKRDKYWNAYSCLLQGDIIGMSLKQELDTYLSRLEERDYVGARKLELIKITLPTTTYYLHTGQAIVTPSKIIDAGNLVFMHKDNVTGKQLYFYPVIGDQSIKNMTHALPENHIILNPTATPSTSHVNAQHEQLVQNTHSLADAYIRINSFGGMNGGQGNILVCAAGKIITQCLSAPLTEKFCHKINLSEDNVDAKHKDFTEAELTLRSQVRWLFDYLINANMSKVHVILSLTGDSVSIYHLHLIHCMISGHLESLGLDDLLKKIGYFDAKEKILAESQTTTLEKCILQRLLTCVYLSEIPENVFSAEEARQLVNDIGGKLLVRHMQPLVNGVVDLIKTAIEEPGPIKDLNELAATVVTLGIGNIENGISIANVTLDDLMDQPQFGGKLHRGQISPSSSLYRHQVAELLQFLLQHNHIMTQSDVRRKTIAHFALHVTTHHNPLDVFIECQKEMCFQQASKQEIFQEIMGFYHCWSKAQYAIHAAPLTFNHNQQAIEHNMGMRTPNINAFQRAELAQLALHYYAHDKLAVSEYIEANERVLIDESWQDILLSFQPTDKNANPLTLLDKKESLIWQKIKTQRRTSAATTTVEESVIQHENIPFRITQASCNQTGGDWAVNIKNIFHAIDIAVENGADFLALSELSLSGYDCGDTFFWMTNTTIQLLLQMTADYAASKNPNLLLSIGHPWKLDPEKKHFNVQSLLGKSIEGDARILLMKYKGNLYGEERGFEHRHFSCELDKDITLTMPALSGKPYYTVTFGRKVVARIGNQQQGFFDLFHGICEEYWKRSEYDDGSGKYYDQLNIISEIKNSGYHIGLYVTAHASPPSPHKFEKQKKLTALASLHGAKHMVVIHTDSLGSSGSSYVNAGTRYAAQHGNIIVEATGVYSFQAVTHNTHTYSLPRAALQGPSAHVICAHVFKNHQHHAAHIQLDSWRSLETYELEAAIRNQVLALYDTMKKSRVRCFTQALSGGADSAWNIVKVRLMIELGIQQLGVKSFLASLHYPEKFIASLSPHSDIINILMKHMAICYYLATQNNSIETENAARRLIEGGIGGTFIKLDIQNLVNRFSFVFLELKNSSPEKMDEILDLLAKILKLRPNDAGKEQYTILEKSLKTCFGDWKGTLLSPSAANLGLTIENAQARIRQMLMSYLTKLLSTHPYLLRELLPKELIENYAIGTCFGLSNPNENEARRAYTTFAGDLHSGEINPNGHLPKDVQLQQMRYIYEQGLHGLSPITSLELILQQTPSAELQPKNESNQVVQSDEQAFGLTFAEATLINHTRVEYTDPRKVFEVCKRNACFNSTDIATLHDKIYITYCGFPIALHKLTAAPDMQTYGEFTTSAKSSMQYPFISVNERYEIARFTLVCLDKLAEQNGINFFTLTGYPFDACSSRIMLDEHFALSLHNAMYSPAATDGRQYKIETLYEKIAAGDFTFSIIFLENVN